MEKTINRKDIEDIVALLYERIGEEDTELFKEVIEKSGFEFPDKLTVGQFYLKLVYPYMDQFLGVLIRGKISTNSDVIFILTHSRFIERHFVRLIYRAEGYMHCADKSRHIMDRLLDFYRDGTKIEFDRTQKYTYHLPVIIFTTHEDIISFYEALRDLYHGSPEAYAKELAKLLPAKPSGGEGGDIPGDTKHDSVAPIEYGEPPTKSLLPLFSDVASPYANFIEKDGGK